MCHSRCSSSTGLDVLQCPQPHSYQDASDKHLRRVSAALIFAHCRCSVRVTEGLGGGVAPAVNTRAPCACNGGINRVFREWSCVRTRWKRKQRCALSSSVETIESSPLSSSPSRRLRQYSSGRLGVRSKCGESQLIATACASRNVGGGTTPWAGGLPGPPLIWHRSARPAPRFDATPSAPPFPTAACAASLCARGPPRRPGSTATPAPPTTHPES
jgi:hypothetical protein